MIPDYLIVGELGWLDTLRRVIVPAAAGGVRGVLPPAVLPVAARELEEAALIDGANRWQIFIRVILPLSKPALVTLAVLAFLTNWNDFLWPVYVLFSPEARRCPRACPPCSRRTTSGTT